jgi:tetratricopeptide (TPR) repeat protein
MLTAVVPTQEGLASAAAVLKSVRDLTVSLVITLAITAALTVIVIRIARSDVVIEPINLNQELLSSGLTPAIAAERLRDHILQVREQTRIEAEVSFASPKLILNGERPNIVVPETGISFEAIAGYARDLLKIEQPRISGEIVKVGANLEIRLREQSLGLISKHSVSPRTPVDQLLAESAVDVVCVLEPLTAQVFLFHRDTARAIDIAKSLIASNDVANAVRGRAYNLLGVASTNDNDYPAAEREFSEAARLDPQLAYVYLRNRCEAEGTNPAIKPEQAIATCRKAIDLHPRYARGYFTLGNVLLERSLYADAISAYLKAIAIDRDDNGLGSTRSDTYSNLATAHHLLGMKLRKQQPAAAIQELNKAKTYFENAIRLAPKDSELLLVIALQYFMNQDKPTATGYLRRAIAVNKPATVSAINEFADGQLSEGKFDTAIDLYKFALDAAPDVAALQSGLLRAEKQKAAARKDTSKSNETRKP